MNVLSDQKKENASQEQLAGETLNNHLMTNIKIDSKVYIGLIHSTIGENIKHELITTYLPLLHSKDLELVKITAYYICNYWGNEALPTNVLQILLKLPIGEELKTRLLNKALPSCSKSEIISYLNIAGDTFQKLHIYRSNPQLAFSRHSKSLVRTLQYAGIIGENTNESNGKIKVYPLKRI